MSVLFLWQQVTWAQGAAVSQPVTQDREVAIPQEKAYAKEINIQGSDELIINIQDAHDSLSAQYSIVDILGTLAKEYDLSLVALEGSAGYIDTSLLKVFPVSDVREAVADSLMKDGELSAGEFFGIVNEKDIALYGIEDNKLYTEHLESFRGNIQKKAANVRAMDTLISQLEEIAEKIYPDSVKELEIKSSGYKAGKISFADYWEYMSGIGGQHAPGDRYTNLSKLTRSMEMEKAIDFRRANSERKLLISELKRTLPKKRLEELLYKSLQYKLKKIEEPDFHRYITGLAGKIDRERYKNLLAYTEYVSFYREIDLAGMFSELEGLEDSIKDSLFKNPDQRTLRVLFKEARLLKSLFGISLTNERFDRVLENIENLKFDRFDTFLRKMKAASYAEREHFSGVFDSIDEAVHFYRLARERDRALIDNTVKTMRKEGRKAAALITGGFHTKGLTNILKSRKTSYIVLVPKFDTDAPRRPYVAILTRKNGKYTELLDTGKYQIATYSHFGANPGLFYDSDAVREWARTRIVRRIAQQTEDYPRDEIRRNLDIWIDAYRRAQLDLMDAGRTEQAPVEHETLREMVREEWRDLKGYDIFEEETHYAITSLEIGANPDRLVDDPYGDGKVFLEKVVSGEGLKNTYLRLLEIKGAASTLPEVGSQNIIERAETAADKVPDARNDEDKYCLDVVLNSIDRLAETVAAEVAEQTEAERVRAVLFGGAAEGGGEFYREELQTRVNRCSKPGQKIEIVLSEMGDKRAIVGAVGYARYVASKPAKPAKKYAIGVDLGGTNIRAALVNLETMETEREIVKTLVFPDDIQVGDISARAQMDILSAKIPAAVEAKEMDFNDLPYGLDNYLESLIDRDIHESLSEILLHQMVSLISTVGLDEVDFISIAAPGVFKEEGPVELAYNLPLTSYDLKGKLAKHLNMPVYMGNDVAIAGVGEMISGAGKGLDLLFSLNVGTGVNMCLVEKSGPAESARTSTTSAGSSRDQLQRIKALEKKLDDESSNVRVSALFELKRMAETTDHVDVLTKLLGVRGQEARRFEWNVMQNAEDNKANQQAASAYDAMTRNAAEKRFIIIIQTIDDASLLKKIDKIATPEMKKAIAGTIGRLQTKSGARQLVESLQKEGFQREIEVAAAQGEIGDSNRTEFLIAQLEENWDGKKDPQSGKTAAASLAREGKKAVLPLIRSLQERKNGFAAIALGEIEDKRAVRPLIAVLESDDHTELARKYAVIALGEIGGRNPVPALLAELEKNSGATRLDALRALGKIRDRRATQPVIKAMQLSGWGIHEVCVIPEVLGNIGDPKAADALISMSGHEEVKMRMAAATALGKVGNKNGTAQLVEMLKDRSFKVRMAAAEALDALNWKPKLTEEPDRIHYYLAKKNWRAIKKIGVPAVAVLIEALELEDWDFRQAVTKTLGEIGDARAVGPILDIWERQSRVFGVSTEAYINIGEPAVPELILALKDKSPFARSHAAKALGEIGDVRAVEPLIETLDDENSDVCRNAAQALGKLGDKRAIEPLNRVLNKKHEAHKRPIRESLASLESAREVRDAILPEKAPAIPRLDTATVVVPHPDDGVIGMPPQRTEKLPELAARVPRFLSMLLEDNAAEAQGAIARALDNIYDYDRIKRYYELVVRGFGRYIETKLKQKPEHKFIHDIKAALRREARKQTGEKPPVFEQALWSWAPLKYATLRFSLDGIIFIIMYDYAAKAVRLISDDEFALLATEQIEADRVKEKPFLGDWTTKHQEMAQETVARFSKEYNERLGTDLAPRVEFVNSNELEERFTVSERDDRILFVFNSKWWSFEDFQAAANSVVPYMFSCVLSDARFDPEREKYRVAQFDARKEGFTVAVDGKKLPFYTSQTKDAFDAGTLEAESKRLADEAISSYLANLYVDRQVSLSAQEKEKSGLKLKSEADLERFGFEYDKIRARVNAVFDNGEDFAADGPSKILVRIAAQEALAAENYQLSLTAQDGLEAYSLKFHDLARAIINNMNLPVSKRGDVQGGYERMVFGFRYLIINTTLQAPCNSRIPFDSTIDFKEAALFAAREIVSLLLRKPDAVIGCATGSTMPPVYEILARYVNEFGMDLSTRPAFFNLDEYYYPDMENPRIYRAYMEKNFFKKIANPAHRPKLVTAAYESGRIAVIEEGNAYLPEAPRDEKGFRLFCAWYENEIARRGGIDIQLLGIGRGEYEKDERDETGKSFTRDSHGRRKFLDKGGHIGFNEPPEIKLECAKGNYPKILREALLAVAKAHPEFKERVRSLRIGPGSRRYDRSIFYPLLCADMSKELFEEHTVVRAFERISGKYKLDSPDTVKEMVLFFSSPTRKIKLTPTTRRANKEDFSSASVPDARFAVSTGLGSILRARRVILLALGDEKADVVASCGNGTITPFVPATILQMHPNARLMLDELAGEHLLENPHRFTAEEWIVNLLVEISLDKGRSIRDLTPDEIGADKRMQRYLKETGMTPAQAKKYALAQLADKVVTRLPKSTLVIGTQPHPDDIPICIGGMIALISGKGSGEVTNNDIQVLTSTNGYTAIWDCDIRVPFRGKVVRGDLIKQLLKHLWEFEKQEGIEPFTVPDEAKEEFRDGARPLSNCGIDPAAKVVVRGNDGNEKPIEFSFINREKKPGTAMTKKAFLEEAQTKAAAAAGMPEELRQTLAETELILYDDGEELQEGLVEIAERLGHADLVHVLRDIDTSGMTDEEKAEFREMTEYLNAAVAGERPSYAELVNLRYQYWHKVKLPIRSKEDSDAAAKIGVPEGNVKNLMLPFYHTMQEGVKDQATKKDLAIIKVELKKLLVDGGYMFRTSGDRDKAVMDELKKNDRNKLTPEELKTAVMVLDCVYDGKTAADIAVELKRQDKAKFIARLDAMLDTIGNTPRLLEPVLFLISDDADPMGTHGNVQRSFRKCMDILLEEYRILKPVAFVHYHGAWGEYPLAYDLAKVVNFGEEINGYKQDSIIAHASQDPAKFPGDDIRPFWKRALDRNSVNAKVLRTALSGDVIKEGYAEVIKVMVVTPNEQRALQPPPGTLDGLVYALPGARDNRADPRTARTSTADERDRDKHSEILELDKFVGNIKWKAVNKGLLKPREGDDKRFFLHVGKGLETSQTYRLYNYLFNTLGKVDIICIPYEAGTKDELKELMRLFRLSPHVIGLTLGEPHKLDIKDFLESSEIEEGSDPDIGLSLVVKDRGGNIRAVQRKGEEWVRWYNDEVRDKARGPRLNNRRVTILGAGATGRRIAEALLEQGVKDIVISDKDTAAAEVFLATLHSKMVASGANINMLCAEPESATLSSQIAKSDIIINATGEGKEGEKVGLSPIDFAPESVPAGSVAIDLNYRPEKTRFLQQAELQGAHIYNGLGYFAYTNSYQAHDLLRYADTAVPTEDLIEAVKFFASSDFSFRTRSEMVDRLKADVTVDVAVIGGGIAGVNIARDAAMSGLSVVLLEKGDFASGTSSGSAKLIHRGLKYLILAWEGFKKLRFISAIRDIMLFVKASKEAKTLQDIAPHLIKPTLRHIVITEDDNRSIATIFIGMWLYKLIGVLTGNKYPYEEGFQKGKETGPLYQLLGPRYSPPKCYLDKSDIAERFPELDVGNVRAVFTCWDAQTDDARLTLETARSAHKNGAITINYASLQGYTPYKAMYRPRTEDYCGLEVFDMLTNRQIEVRARRIVNAAGPWADKVRNMNRMSSSPLEPSVDLVAGMHVDVYPAISDESLVITAPDGRLVSAIVRDEDGLRYSRIGSTDTRVEKPDRSLPKPEEVKYLIDSIKRAIPQAEINEDTIMRVDYAVRPLAKGDADKTAFKQSRRHRVEISEGGRMITVVGVNLTDMRKAAEEVVDKLWSDLRPGEKRVCRTAIEPLNPEGARLPYDAIGPRQATQRGMAIRLSDYVLRRQGLRPFIRHKNDEYYLEDTARAFGEVQGWNEGRIRAEAAECRRQMLPIPSTDGVFRGEPTLYLATESAEIDTKSLQARFAGLRIITLPGESSGMINYYVQTGREQNNNILGLVLGDIADLSIDDLEHIINHHVMYTLFDRPEEVADIVDAIQREVDQTTTLAAIREYSFNERELRRIIGLVSALYSPIAAKDAAWQSQRVAAVKRTFADTTAMKATFATSGVFNRNKNMLDELSANLLDTKDRNVLLITNPAVSRRDVGSYVERLGLDKYYNRNNVLTYDEFEALASGQNDIELAVNAIMNEKLGHDSSREIICIDGYDVLREEITNIRTLIAEVLGGNTEAIRQALAILGKDATWISEEDIERRIIDLKSRTEEMRNTQRSREQLGQAL